MATLLLQKAILVLLLSQVTAAQKVKCVTVQDGCDDQNAHEAALRSAVGKFQNSKLYGNSSSPIIFSSALGDDGSLAQISYACNDGSSPPTVLGSSVKSYIESILSCAHQCGSVSHPDNANCGFGVLIANDAATTDCFSKALNVAPAAFDPVEKPSEGDWRLNGCYVDDVPNNERALTGGGLYAKDMTLTKCLTRAAGFKYAGLEGSTECYFGNEISSATTEAPRGDCNFPCGGLITQACGATRRIRIYENTAGPISTPISTTTSTSSTTTRSSSPTPTIVSSVDSYKSPTCYAEDQSSRVLVNGSSSATGMTVEKCVKLAESWRYGGLTAGSQCFWGDTLLHPQTTTQTDCLASPCAGDSTEACGAGNRMLVYADDDFNVLTRPETAELVEEYMRLLSELQGLILEWNSLIDEYYDSVGTDGLTKRDLDGLLRLISNTQSYLIARRAAWELFRRVMRVAGRRGHRYSRVQEAESYELDDLGFETVGMLNRIASVKGAALSVRRTVARDVKVQVGGFTAVGVGFFGLFLKGFTLLNGLRMGGDDPPPEDPENPGIPSLPTWPPAEVLPLPPCQMETCQESGECRLASRMLMRTLGKRVYPTTAPADIENVDTLDITLSSAFTDENSFTTGNGDEDPGETESRSWWWRMMKRLVWETGSHHGYPVDGQPYVAHPSSRFVDFRNNNPSGTVVTGAGPVWGCTCLVVVTERGAYTTHWWENPFFVDNEGAFPEDLFSQNVISFLATGDYREGQTYPGLFQHTLVGEAFNNPEILFVGIMTPENSATQEARYPEPVRRIREEVAAILHISEDNILVRTYPEDFGLLQPKRIDEATGKVLEWHRDRTVRRHTEPYNGYLTVQRRATDGSGGERPAVRVFFEREVVWTGVWGEQPTPDPPQGEKRKGANNTTRIKISKAAL